MKTTGLAACAAVVLLGCGGDDGGGDDGGDPPDAPGPSTTFKLTSYRAGVPANTDLVAIQDGDGPFVPLTGTAGVYTAQLYSERFGLFVGCVDPRGNAGNQLIYAAISDGTTWYSGGCVGPGDDVTITGSITGAGTDPVNVLFDFAQVEVPAPAMTYSLPVRPGPGKLIAAQLVGDVPVKLVAHDTVASTGLVVDLDFTAGFAPITRDLTPPPGLTGASVGYRDVNSFVRIGGLKAPYTSYFAFPVDRLGNGLTRLSMFASDIVGTRNTIKYFAEPVVQAATLPLPLELARPVTRGTGPYPTVAVHLRPMPEGASLYELLASTSVGQAFRLWLVQVTAGWLARTAGPDVAFPMPDLTQVAGWRADFQLHAGQRISWHAEAIKNVNVPLFASLPPDQFQFRDGSETQLASRSGELAP